MARIYGRQSNYKWTFNENDLTYHLQPQDTYMHKVELFQDFKIVKVMFLNQDSDKVVNGDSVYSYKYPPAMQIEEGSLIIVPAKGHFQIVLAKEVDVPQEQQAIGTAKMRWVVGPLNLTPYQDLVARELEQEKILFQAERRAETARLREHVLAVLNDDDKKLLLTNGGITDEGVSTAGQS